MALQTLLLICGAQVNCATRIQAFARGRRARREAARLKELQRAEEMWLVKRGNGEKGGERDIAYVLAGALVDGTARVAAVFAVCVVAYAAVCAYCAFSANRRFVRLFSTMVKQGEVDKREDGGAALAALSAATPAPPAYARTPGPVPP